MNRLYKTLALAITATLALHAPVVKANSDAPFVTIDGSKVSFDVDPIIEDGTTLVQFRPIFEKLGLSITWDEKQKKITGTNGTQAVELQVGSKVAKVNNQRKELQLAPRIVDGNTMVPLRFIGEATGKRVSWNEKEMSVSITKGVEVVETVMPYGGESYIEPSSVSLFSSKLAPSVYEADGVVYVIWTKNDVSGRDSYMNIYASIAQNGKWVVKNRMVSRIEIDEGFRNQKFIVGNEVYWRSTYGILKVSVDEFGNGRTSNLIGYGSVKGQTEFFYPLNMRYEKGFIFGQKDNMKMYIESKIEDPIPVADLFHVLSSEASTADQYVYRGTDLLSIYNGVGLRQLNIESGEMIYENGKDRVVTISEKASRTNLLTNYHEGRMEYLYLDGGDRTYKFGYIDENDFVENGIMTNLAPINGAKFSITQANGQLHLWSSDEFERKPMLQYISIIK